MRRLLLAAVALLWPLWPQAAPARVLSLNLCTDQLLLQLLPPERIVGLTAMAADPVYSAQAGRASGLPVVLPELEAVLSRQPDLVLAAEYTDPLLLARLAGMGVAVARFAIPETLPGTLQFIEQVAIALSEPEAGQRLAADLALRWQQLGMEAARRTPERVLIFRPGGITLGADTLEGAVLAQAGLINIAVEMQLPSWSALSLETLLRVRPDRVLVDDDGRHRYSLAQEIIHHPALAGLTLQAMPHRDWICPSPALADAVARLLEPGA